MSSETSSRARVPPKDLPIPRTSRWTAPPAIARSASARSGISPATPRAQELVDVVLRHDAAVGQVGEESTPAPGSPVRIA